MNFRNLSDEGIILSIEDRIKANIGLLNNKYEDSVQLFEGGFGDFIEEVYGQDSELVDHPHLIMHQIRALKRGDFWLNLYRIERLYGGPEEGGWWYNAHSPIFSMDLNIKDHRDLTLNLIRYFYDKYDFEDYDNIYSVNNRGIYDINIESNKAEHSPKHKPRYE